MTPLLPTPPDDAADRSADGASAADGAAPLPGAATAGAPGDPRATLVSVARAAGVSRQTVSNVLNAPDRVGPETTARVLDAVRAQNYRPSVAARQLRTRRSHSLALRLEPTRDGIDGSVLDVFLHALTERAQDADYRVTIFTARDDADEVTGYERLLSTADLDGFVLTSTHHGDPRTAWLAARGVPFVTFGRPWGELPEAEGAAGAGRVGAGGDGAAGVGPAAHCWVDVDGAAGTRAATEHLLARGHRRTAFLGWPEGSGVGDDRRAGWLTAVRAAGAPTHPSWDLRVTNDTAAADAAVSALLAAAPAGEAPTAVVCASDSLALGVRAAALRSGRTLTAVGFDDTPVAAALGLSSIAQPLAGAAAEAVRMLGEQLGDQRAGPAGSPRQVLLAPRLVVRDDPDPR